MIINAFFTNERVAALGLSPLISIWEHISNTRSVVIASQPTIELGDGFYSYDFTTYDNQKDYTILVDAGAAMATQGRYNVSALSPVPANVTNITQTTIDKIVDDVWDESGIAHMIPGSTGEMHNQIKADTAAILIDLVSINQLLQLLKKYERNRTKIDAGAKTLTVYDTDGVTPLQVFNLKDSAGAASVDEVMERVPTLP